MDSYKTIPCICMKMNTPTVYNKGTEWERTCDTFLYKYYYGSIQSMAEEINRLNKEVASKIANNELEAEDGMTYYASEQECMY